MSEKKPADLDAWLAALDHPRKAEVASLVAVALAARAGITGPIKWNAPSFVYAGDGRVTLGLRPNGALQIVFHRGARVKDAAGFAFADDSGLIEMVAPDRGVVTGRGRGRRQSGGARQADRALGRSGEVAKPSFKKPKIYIGQSQGR